MEIIDDQKFYQQMERLKQETFWKYLTHSHQFLYFIPLLCLIDFYSIHIFVVVCTKITFIGRKYVSLFVLDI